MTANQAKRIRRRLEEAARLTREAHELYRQCNPSYEAGDRELRDITSSAADAGNRILQSLEWYDQGKRQKAEAAAFESNIAPGAVVADHVVEGQDQIVGRVTEIDDNDLVTIQLARLGGCPTEGVAHRPKTQLFRLPEMALDWTERI